MYFIKRGLMFAVLAVGLVPSTSGAASYLHGGTASGNVLAAGTAIMGNVATPATLNLSGLGDISCLAGGSSGLAGVSGGATVGGTFTSGTLSSCVDTIPVLTISGCSFVAPLPAVSATATGSTGGTTTFSNAYMRCNVSGGTSGCYYYAANATGTYTNSTHLLAFSGVAVTHTVPTGGTGDLGSLCGNTGAASGTVGPVTVTSSGAQVWLNDAP